jgi:hypothetical protein
MFTFPAAGFTAASVLCGSATTIEEPLGALFSAMKVRRRALQADVQSGRREALVISFADVFLVLTALIAALSLLLFLMEKPVPAARRT